MNPLLVLLAGVTVVFGVALLGALLASRTRAALRHLILACAFLIVLILPLAAWMSPTIAVEIAALPALEAEPIATDLLAPLTTAPVEIAPVPAKAIPVAPTPPLFVASRSIAVTTWLVLAWALTSVIALLPIAAGLLHFRRIRRSSHLWREGAERAAELMHPVALPRLTVLLNVAIAAPITGGLIRPAIALPADAMTWSDAHLTNALLHELEHVRRCDWTIHLVARAACALYWFHPLSWIAWRALRLEAERACDDAVLVQEDGTVYAEQLLGLARRISGQPGLPGLHMAGDSNLSARIKSALDAKRPRGRTGKAAVAIAAFGAILAIALLAPLRPTRPIRHTAALALPDRVSLTPVAAQLPPLPEKRSAIAFTYNRNIGLADLRDSGCLSIFNSSVEPGTKVTLLTPRASDPPFIVEATVTAIQARECGSSLDRNDGTNTTPTYYRMAMPSSSKQYGIAFAILDPPGTIALRNGEITADIDGDGSPESFETCTSAENVHYMVWSGFSAQRRQRWHGNIYFGYDMEPTCTDGDIAGMQASPATAQEPRTAPVADSGGKTTSPREVVSGILELIQSALADDVTGKLDDIERPITGLHHVQRHALAVLNDDGSSPGTLAAHYVEIVNALVTTANSAATIAGRRPELGLSQEKFQQLAAAMRAKSAELATAVMPTSDIRPNIATPEHWAALNALELAQAARRETRFSPSWLPTHLNTLERAALSVASDDGTAPDATTMKVSLLRSALGVATRQANEIAGRATVVGDVRRKAAELATSLSGVIDQLDRRTVSEN